MSDPQNSPFGGRPPYETSKGPPPFSEDMFQSTPPSINLPIPPLNVETQSSQYNQVQSPGYIGPHPPRNFGPPYVNNRVPPPGNFRAPPPSLNTRAPPPINHGLPPPHNMNVPPPINYAFQNTFQEPPPQSRYPSPDYAQRQGCTFNLQQNTQHAFPPNQNYREQSILSSTSGAYCQLSQEGIQIHPFLPPSHPNALQTSCQHWVDSDSYQSENASQETSDSNWLRIFEKQIQERGKLTFVRKTTAQKKPLKLIEVQKLVSKMKALKDNLIEVKKKMALLQEDTVENEWCYYVEQADKTKNEVECIMAKLQDKDFIEEVRKLVLRRRKKRERKKKQKKLKVVIKKEFKESWEKEEQKIDAWREKLHREEEEKRRELAIKTEADSVLSEVRQKQSDCSKMKQLLESLDTLRKVRLNKGSAHGFISTAANDQFFSITLKNIADVVDTQMDEYKLEEKTLRVMMEESTSYKRSNSGHDTGTNKLETMMKKMLFGNTKPINQQSYDEFTAADCCLQTLIQRRMDWDQYICNEDLPMAFSVPASWVVPPSQPNSTWVQYQS